jgi:hypothetical protein
VCSAEHHSGRLLCRLLVNGLLAPPDKHGCNGKLILTAQSDAIGIAARDALIGFGRRDERS